MARSDESLREFSDGRLWTSAEPTNSYILLVMRYKCILGELTFDPLRARK
jgi:hypothetical protein